MLPLLLFACSPAAPVASPVDSGVVSADTSVADDAGPLHFDGEPPTNVLMLTLDTTRRDLFARHGGGDYTPALDALSEQSVVLNDLRSLSLIHI